jgi:hypothetical protein
MQRSKTFFIWAQLSFYLTFGCLMLAYLNKQAQIEAKPSLSGCLKEMLAYKQAQIEGEEASKANKQEIRRVGFAFLSLRSCLFALKGQNCLLILPSISAQLLI